MYWYITSVGKDLLWWTFHNANQLKNRIPRNWCSKNIDKNTVSTLPYHKKKVIFIYIFINDLKIDLLSDAMLLFQHGPIFFIHHEVNQNSTRNIHHFSVSWVQHSHQHSVNLTTICCHKHHNTFLSFHNLYYPFKY